MLRNDPLDGPVDVLDRYREPVTTQRPRAIGCRHDRHQGVEPLWPDGGRSAWDAPPQAVLVHPAEVGVPVGHQRSSAGGSTRRRLPRSFLDELVPAVAPPLTAWGGPVGEPG